MRRSAAVVLSFAALASAALLLSAPAFGATEFIGSVKNVRGQAGIVREGRRTPAEPGLKLLPGDVLETGADGSLGLILRDNSLLSLGPSSRVAIEEFLFVPAEKKLGLTARILRGTLAYVSGLIGRLAPESTTFVTPVATIGVRGTHFAVRVAE